MLCNIDFSGGRSSVSVYMRIAVLHIVRHMPGRLADNLHVMNDSIDRAAVRAEGLERRAADIGPLVGGFQHILQALLPVSKLQGWPPEGSDPASGAVIPLR